MQMQMQMWVGGGGGGGVIQPTYVTWPLAGSWNSSTVSHVTPPAEPFKMLQYCKAGASLPYIIYTVEWVND